MTHAKRFQTIPMSKSMREICREEDYVFLSTRGQLKRHVTPKDDATVLGDDWKDKKEERNRRRMERERQEQERLQEIERCKKEKEEQWRSRVAERAATEEQAVRDRLARLRKFKEFQRKVLVEEAGMESEAAFTTINHLLNRM